MAAQEMKSIEKDSSYLIVEDPKDFYEGIYRNAKPRNGYFKKDDVELFTVDYYENGTKKYNYSSDVLQMIGNDESDGDYRLKLNVKSTYRDGKIYSGVKYNYIEGGALVEQYQDGKHKGFYVDLFAMHYYNRISFEKEKDQIEIRSMQDEDYKIRLFLKSNHVAAELSKNDSVLIRMQNINEKESIFPINSSVRVYKEFGIINGLAYQNFDKMGIVYEEAMVLTDVLDRLEIYYGKDHLEIFDRFLKDIIYNNGFLTKPINEDPLIMIGDFVSDEEGNVKDGIRFFEDPENTYYRIYKNGKIIKKEYSSIDDFQDIFLKYIEEKYNKED